MLAAGHFTSSTDEFYTHNKSLKFGVDGLKVMNILLRRNGATAQRRNGTTAQRRSGAAAQRRSDIM